MRGKAPAYESIVNTHNPSIEVQLSDPTRNTRAAVVLMSGGGRTTLNVGAEGADFVPLFDNRIIHGSERQVNEALQPIRLVRAYAREWNIDPKKIGIIELHVYGNGRHVAACRIATGSRSARGSTAISMNPRAPFPAEARRRDQGRPRRYDLSRPSLQRRVVPRRKRNEPLAAKAAVRCGGNSIDRMPARLFCEPSSYSKL